MKRFIIIILTILIFFSLHAEKIASFPNVINPQIMESDGEQLYILDGINIHITSMKDFSSIKTFGKKGEGPGEMMVQNDLPLSIQIHEEHILVSSFNKLAYFSKNTGEFIREMKLPFLNIQIVPLKKNFAAIKFIRKNDGTSKMGVILYNQKLEEIKTLFEAELLNDQGKGKIAVPVSTIYMRNFSDILYVYNPLEEFVIHRFDSGGNRLKSLTMPYEKIRPSENYKKETIEWLKLQPTFKQAPERVFQMLYFLDYLPVMKDFIIKDNKIFAHTYKSNQDMAEFFILDLKGNILQKVFLPDAKRKIIRGNPGVIYTVLGDKFYYLKENIDEEEWELHTLQLPAVP